MTKQENALNEMKVEYMDAAKLKRPERNVRIHTELQLKELERSLKMFGQTRLAVIDEDDVILVGNGMVEAMMRIGMFDVACLRKTGMSQEEKYKLMLADNRIYGLGHDDSVNIQHLLGEMEDLDVPGFDSDVLEALAVNVEDMESTLEGYGSLDDEDVEKANKGNQNPDARNIICPNCGESIWIQ
jgi:hypothetical protein